MNFNLKYYRVFVAVYENRSMSIAAEKLFFSQPAVSRIIQELETAYNTRFFHRHAGTLQYTEGGKKFYFHARQLLEMEEQLDLAMADQRKRHKVHIGATPTAATYYLPDLLESYRHREDALDVYIHTLPNSGLDELLKNSRLDFAIVEGAHPTYETEIRHITDDRVVFVARDPEQVPSPMPILLRDLGERARQEMESALFSANIPFVIRGEFTDVDGIKQYAARGMGVGILPRGTLTPADPLHELELPDLNITMSLSLAYHRKKFLFPELQELMEFLESGLARR